MHSIDELRRLDRRDLHLFIASLIKAKIENCQACYGVMGMANNQLVHAHWTVIEDFGDFVTQDFSTAVQQVEEIRLLTNLGYTGKEVDKLLVKSFIAIDATRRPWTGGR